MDTGLCSRSPASFNSRPHKEVDEIEMQRTFPVDAFNSRPHKEVDNVNCRWDCTRLVLSIHDLTRRSTLLTPFGDNMLGLSIHDLTRRST